MSHIVLVHGAFHNAGCWDQLIPFLKADGHTVNAIDLPGHGKDQTPLDQVTLDAYSQAVVDALRDAPERVVLVGHSMSGVVVTQAADAFISDGGIIDKLIYVAAFVPRNGQSLVDLSGQPEGAGDMVQANVQVSGEPPIGVMPLDKAIEAFYGDCTPEVAAAAAAELGPQPILAFVTPVAITDDRDIDRRYIVTTRDKAIPPTLQRKMSSDTAFTEVVEIGSDHSPFLSHTDELATILSGFLK